MDFCLNVFRAITFFTISNMLTSATSIRYYDVYMSVGPGENFIHLFIFNVQNYFCGTLGFFEEFFWFLLKFCEINHSV